MKLEKIMVTEDKMPSILDRLANMLVGNRMVLTKGFINGNRLFEEKERVNESIAIVKSVCIGEEKLLDKIKPIVIIEFDRKVNESDTDNYKTAIRPGNILTLGNDCFTADNMVDTPYTTIYMWKRGE